MADQETSTLSDADLQRMAVAEGRCPYCGRRNEDDEHKLFKELREGIANANTQRDRAEQRLEKTKEERDQLKVRNADLRADNKELRRVAANG